MSLPNFISRVLCPVSVVVIGQACSRGSLVIPKDSVILILSDAKWKDLP